MVKLKPNMKKTVYLMEFVYCLLSSLLTERKTKQPKTYAS